MRKHSSYEESGLVWINAEDLPFGAFPIGHFGGYKPDGVKIHRHGVLKFRYGSIIYDYSDEEYLGELALVKLSEWQRETAKAIFGMIEDCNILSISGRDSCYAVVDGTCIELSINLFPFEDGEIEIRREEVMK